MAPHGPESAPASYETQHLPGLIDVTTQAFRKSLGGWIKQRNGVFVPGEEGTSRLPFDSTADFRAQYDKLPPNQQNLVREFATLLREYEKGDWIVNGDRLWEHQQALLTEIFCCLSVPSRFKGTGTDILMEEGPGTGKTRIMGVMIQMLTRMQVRGTMQGNILVLMKRRSLVTQQALSWEERRAAVLQGSEKRTWLDARYYLAAALGGTSVALPSVQQWMELASRPYENQTQAYEALVAFLREKNVLKTFNRHPEKDRLLAECTELLLRRGTFVHGPDEVSFEFLPLSPPGSDDEGGKDLRFGIDPQLEQGSHVYAQTDLKLDALSPKERPGADTRMAFLSRTALTQHPWRVQMSDFLGKVEWIFVDEAGLTNPGAFQSMVDHPDIGGKSPNVLAATAFNRGGQLSYQRHLSRLSVEKAINGPDRVLRPPRLDVFPAIGEPLYPSGSYEAFEQLLQYYRQHRAFPADQGAPQPWEGPHLIIVDKNLVPYAVERLRTEFADTPTTFLSMDANSDEAYNARIQLRMNDRGLPNTCLVASTHMVIDSFDWPYLRAIYIGVHDQHASCEYLYRLCGRLLHSQNKDTHINQQRHANPHSRNNLIWRAYDTGLPIVPEHTFALTPGQSIIGIEKMLDERDAIRSGTYETREVPSSIKTSHPAWINLQQGTFPPELGEQRKKMAAKRPPLPKITVPEPGTAVRAPRASAPERNGKAKRNGKTQSYALSEDRQAHEILEEALAKMSGRFPDIVRKNTDIYSSLMASIQDVFQEGRSRDDAAHACRLDLHRWYESAVWVQKKLRERYGEDVPPAIARHKTFLVTNIVVILKQFATGEVMDCSPSRELERFLAILHRQAADDKDRPLWVEQEIMG